jgi:hypothetical protein
VTPITIRSNQSSARCGEKPRNTSRHSPRVIEDSRGLRLPWPDTRDGRTDVRELTKSPASLGPGGAESLRGVGKLLQYSPRGFISQTPVSELGRHCDLIEVSGNTGRP